MTPKKPTTTISQTYPNTKSQTYPMITKQEQEWDARETAKEKPFKKTTIEE